MKDVGGVQTSSSAVMRKDCVPLTSKSALEYCMNALFMVLYSPIA